MPNFLNKKLESTKDSGFVLILGLLMMMVMLMFASAATSFTTAESSISVNLRNYEMLFRRSETHAFQLARLAKDSQMPILAADAANTTQLHLTTSLDAVLHDYDHDNSDATHEYGLSAFEISTTTADASTAARDQLGVEQQSDGAQVYVTYDITNAEERDGILTGVSSMRSVIRILYTTRLEAYRGSI